MAVMVTELYTALRSAGVDEAQSKAAAQAVIAELATKADLQVTTAMLKTELAELKADLIRWNVGTLIAMTAIYGGLVVALKLFA